VAPEGATVPSFAPTDPLGGWIRGFDTDTYNVAPTCAQGEQGATCQADIEPPIADGLLDQAGWRLLDDTSTAVWTKQGWVQPRPANGDLEDGYLFVYGHDYTGALETLARLTGASPLLPRNEFGVWYSDYTPYSSATIEQSLYPAFVSHNVPLDTLSLDTDWKAPNDWNGWEWNKSLFPNASSFLSWARARGLAVTLNVHSSIDNNDPKLGAAERIAGHTLAASSCTNGPCKVWDWSSIAQAESNFELQQSFERQGVNFWWLDWCCDDSVVSMSGLTPDDWIDHLYAQEMANRGQRGFTLARIGGSNANPEEAYPAGPWSSHTSTVAFTGDAWGTWNTLAAEAELTSAEASIGQSYVSDDIGSYLGPPPTQSGADPPDLYDRWVQLGTFQPILRLHSNNEDRLPWQYPEPVQSDTEAFLRLRQQLVPYTYTLADQTHQTGLPMARPLYLDDPGQPAAYTNPTEYLFGPDMLVAPVTTPGDVAPTTVWFPPGRWIDFFTGASFNGPTTATIAEPLDRMPVFVKAGGIVPEQPSTVRSTTSPRSLTVKVFPGATGSFTLYSDAGTGLGYTKGQSAETTITTSTGALVGQAATAGRAPVVRATILPTRGRYPGQSRTIDYQLDLVDVSPPSRVTLNGKDLAEQANGAPKVGWSYDAHTDTAIVDVGSISGSRAVNVAAVGASPVSQSEPTTASSS
jgi:alpha-glucosidase (family GH31 glycosyl hydrolase)